MRSFDNNNSLNHDVEVNARSTILFKFTQILGYADYDMHDGKNNPRLCKLSLSKSSRWHEIHINESKTNYFVIPLPPKTKAISNSISQLKIKIKKF